ncbi:unnamed protein product [Brachionus calyciflorus]|uniref:ATP-dependent (S)-NAD(P)H-hydrate dehydratase n=1 Tax=Brachionus calyciflorus TaxID=104777 RepID=A0A813M2G5_9BILA|nr:unnamed protein product [Brachionus calyciflorus]
MSINNKIIQNFKELIPKLHKGLHKGQSGRIGIIGGSRDYSGAPYFSSMSCLRAGADLTYLLTTTSASPTIKAYSPELIVLPILDDPCYESEVQSLMKKFHSLIIGPGLGRTDAAFENIKIAIKHARSQNIPIVIDADGIYLLASDTSHISGYEKCILTPNFMEFKRLYEKSFKNEEYDEESKFNTLEAQCEAVKRLAQRLENVTILKKGQIDVISDGKHVICNDLEGSLKRCGGIGDLLTGILGLFSYWCDLDKSKESKTEEIPSNIVACYSASVFIRECSKIAFSKYHRAFLAVDVIEEIAQTFYQMFDKK